MRRAASALGVEYRDALVEPFEGDRMRFGPGDPGFTERSAIRPELGEVWRHIRLPRQLSPITRGVARRLGYELPFDAPVGDGLRISDAT